MDFLLNSQLKYFLNMCPWLLGDIIKVKTVKGEQTTDVLWLQLCPTSISANRTTMLLVAQAEIPDFISFPLASQSVQKVLWSALQNK